MNVGGLVITGVFDDRVVTDAVVRIMDEIEGPHNCRFVEPSIMMNPNI